MNYVKLVLPWSPLIITTIFSLISQSYFSMDKTAWIVSLLFMGIMWITTRKIYAANKVVSINTSDIELQKCKNENEKLRENLLQVYNMINKSNGPREAPPRQQQHNTQQPPRAELQNQSAPPVNGGSPQLVEDVDGKPYL